MQAPQMSAYLINGKLPALEGNRSPTGQPGADVFPVADGHIQVVALREPHVEALFGVLGMAERYADYATPALRVEHRDALRAQFREAFQRQPQAYWLERLMRVNVPVSEVRSLEDVARDDQLTSRDTLAEVTTPDRGTHRVVFAGQAASEDGPRLPGSAPRLGEHTDAILSELGFSADEIHAFRQQGVV